MTQRTGAGSVEPPEHANPESPQDKTGQDAQDTGKQNLEPVATIEDHECAHANSDREESLPMAVEGDTPQPTRADTIEGDTQQPTRADTIKGDTEQPTRADTIEADTQQSTRADTNEYSNKEAVVNAQDIPLVNDIMRIVVNGEIDE